MEKHGPGEFRYDVLMASFTGVERAAQVLEKLRAEGRLQDCEIEGEALVTRDAAGEAHFREAGSAGLGATFGAVTAGLIGLVTGPLGLLAMVVAGGMVGGVAGHFLGRVMPAEDLRRVGESLPSNSSAALLLVDAAHAAGVANAFQQEGARVLNIPLETDLSNAVREGITHQITRV